MACLYVRSRYLYVSVATLVFQSGAHGGRDALYTGSLSTILFERKRAYIGRWPENRARDVWVLRALFTVLF